MKNVNENYTSSEFGDKTIEISIASSKDAIEIAALRKKTWLNTYVNEENRIYREDIETKDFDSEKAIEKLSGYMKESDDLITLVARVDDKIVGYCTATKVGQHEIRAIYILPEQQGRGIGSKLMDRAIAWLGNSEDIHLYVAEYNSKTIEFYKNLGFVVTDAPTPQGYKVNGKSIPLVEMTKYK